MLNLYLVKRCGDDVNYDEYASMVVVAATEEDARKMSPREEGDYEDCWPIESDNVPLEITCIGYAVEGAIVGVIHSHFNAG